MMSLFIYMLVTVSVLMACVSRGPLLMAVLVVFLSFLVGLSLLVSVSDWLFIAMVMLYVGGMMILFFYMISLAHTKKSTLNFSYVWLVLLTGLMLETKYDMPLSWFFSGSLYNFSSIFILLVSVAYLLISLVVVSKLLKYFKSSMKIVFND